MRCFVTKTALILLGLLLAAGASLAEHPLSKDDVVLLLIGGTSNERLVKLIEERGVDFQPDAEAAKRLRDLGANDAVLEAIKNAATKPKAVSAPPTEPSAPPARPALSPPASTASAATSVPPEHSAAQVPPSVPAATEKVPPAPRVERGPKLEDPAVGRIQEIAQEFVRKEKLFKAARNNYTYHQTNKIEELDVDNKVVGIFQQDWDVVYDDSGKRVEQVTYSPVSTLRGLGVTAEDLDSMRNVQPFVLTTDELPEYDVKYLGHVKLDELTTYVFSVRPKELKKGRLYFQGTVWVDDRDLQIVKSEGKTVPEARPTKGQFNLFPRFTTYREQIDGKYWFPTYTMADDTLYFPTGPVRMKQIIRYENYKQFKASSGLRVVTELPASDSKTKPKDSPPANPPAKR